MATQPETSRDCMDGTKDEDHNYKIEGEDDPSTGEYMCLICTYCNKQIPYDGRFDDDFNDTYGDYRDNEP